jgi:hypothetical protein
MEMSRTLAGVLAGCLVLVMATVAGAGIPDADASSVSMTAGGKGLVTCPAGDASAYGTITVTALRSDLTPIAGIPSTSFFFTLTGTGSGNVSINCTSVPPETNVGGAITFEAQGDDTVVYGSLTVECQIYTVVLNDSDTLWCNTYDYDDNGTVNPVDFGTFAGDFGGSNQRSDFDWNGSVDPVDFGSFAGHFGHSR